MATAILKFDLNDPDDKREHFRCLKSLDMAIVLFEITHNLKKHCEYVALQKVENDIQDGIYISFEAIHDLLDQHGINIDELIE